jgi:hypothetical protein
LGDSSHRALAKGLWFEAAMWGNPTAQISLADNCMEDYFSFTTSGSSGDTILMSAVLFTMAAQQGDPGARDALARVMSVHCSYFVVPDDDDEYEQLDEDAFLNSPIVKTVLVAEL